MDEARASLVPRLHRRRGPAQGGEDLTEALISRQIPRSVPIAVGPSAHGSANLAGPIELAELYCVLDQLRGGAGGRDPLFCRTLAGRTVDISLN